MVMFSSNTLRDLVTYDGDVCLRCKGIVPREGVHYVPDDGSLCECDILSDVVQHNEPNGILVALREIDAGRREYGEWLRDLEENPHFWMRGYRGASSIHPQYTEAEYEHARLVLIRLASLTEGN